MNGNIFSDIQCIELINEVVEILKNKRNVHSEVIIIFKFKGIKTQCLVILFNCCRMNKSRQEYAAKAGIVPFLKQSILSNIPTKQFAIQLLCEMVMSGRNTRKYLWDCNILSLYLDLLDNISWKIVALESIINW